MSFRRCSRNSNGYPNHRTRLSWSVDTETGQRLRKIIFFYKNKHTHLLLSSEMLLIILLAFIIPNALVLKVDAFGISQTDASERIRAWSSANQNQNILQEFIVEKVPDDDDRSCRLCHFAATVVFPDSLLTSNAANLACRSGRLELNGEKVSGARRVKAGDRITLQNDKSDRRTSVPKDPKRAEQFFKSRLRVLQTLSDEGMSHSPLRVLYEDNCMAIVCKPAGIHTMSWSGTFGKALSLDEILPFLLKPPVHTPGDEPLRAPLPRHRLDNRVAGPVVVAKTRRALVQIGRAFEEKSVQKEYRAIVVGQVKSSCFTIDSEVDGRASETEVTVLGQTPCHVNGILTDLKLSPKTGRQHQLRIHCAEVLGTPILGDDLYSGCTDANAESATSIPVRRRQGLYLYCQRVSLQHPISGEMVSAEIPEPFRFTRTRKKALQGFEWAVAQNVDMRD